MKKSKPYKVIVLGLPKTGTSTLAVMLRMLGYKVTGPEIFFKPGDEQYLENRFKECDAFQDYPWCFEWELFKDQETTKFIILQRDKKSWWKSFFNSYGGKGINYLSYPYIKIEKNVENKHFFLEFYDEHYQRLLDYTKDKPDSFLTLDIETFEWQDLCTFLNEPLPVNIFGKEIEKPHAKRHHGLHRKSKKYLFFSRVRDLFLPMIGEKHWNAIVVFLRKNNLYK